ncbi:hypothetical protein QM480_08615 [Flectobacillus sp. DC10W]|jgi:hypothetical protein|uniref:AMIN domain-containing protein n=1 Tax=Flectobacillus longus TaxID=2984207 RepID=A0ABT6YMG8_9BACT|nr:hypothetical protein [Flectobacillus longus]MDI9864386.1 hypothetical protein [Flectobacillus longus]
MKKLFLAAHLVVLSTTQSTFSFSAVIQATNDKPTKVIFHGVYKIPDHEIYTILKGIRTPINESSQILIEPNSSIILRVVNLKTNQIVAREKIMYMNLTTDLVFESLQGEHILYKRKASTGIEKAVETTKTPVATSVPKVGATATLKTESAGSFVKPKPGTFPEKDGIRSGKGVYDEKAPLNTKATNTTKVVETEKLDPRATLTKVNYPKQKEESAQKVGNLGTINAKPIIIKKATTKPASTTNTKTKVKQ